MRRTRWAAGLGAGLLALLVVPGAALADGNTLRSGQRRQAAARGRDQLGLGARRRHPRDVHAGGLRLPGDRLLPRQERRHGGREDPGQLLDLRRSASTPSASLSPSATATRSSARTASSWPAPTRARTSRSSTSPNGHDHGRDAVVLPVRVLRRLAGDRLGHDARAHQVRRLRHLRDRLLVAHLPDRRALDLRRRLARHAVPHAGLRRLDGGPPDRRHRRVRRAAAARRRVAASTAPTASRGRSRATTCRCSASAC